MTQVSFHDVPGHDREPVCSETNADDYQYCDEQLYFRTDGWDSGKTHCRYHDHRHIEGVYETISLNENKTDGSGDKQQQKQAKCQV